MKENLKVLTIDFTKWENKNCAQFKNLNKILIAEDSLKKVWVQIHGYKTLNQLKMIIQKYKDEQRRNFINYIKSTYLIYHNKKKKMIKKFSKSQFGKPNIRNLRN